MKEFEIQKMVLSSPVEKIKKWFSQDPAEKIKLFFAMSIESSLVVILFALTNPSLETFMVI